LPPASITPLHKGAVRSSLIRANISHTNQNLPQRQTINCSGWGSAS